MRFFLVRRCSFLAAALGLLASQAKSLAAPPRHETAHQRITRTLLVEPADGLTALDSLIDGAASTIDMTMYELVDTDFSGRLVSACARGVKVRVILDQNLEKPYNLPAYTQLNAQAGCIAVWANPAFQVTHQKSILVDGKTLAMLTFNLTSRYYPTSRDFAVVENGAADIAAVQATFNEDFQSTTSFTYRPGRGTDLIWSPTTAQDELLRVIDGATSTLLIENEEMGAPNIVVALENRCRASVAVNITMTANTTYQANFNALVAAGCGVHLYPDTPTGLYIHAKAMVADYGLPTQKVYVGSINFSLPSMDGNRELGLFVSEKAIVDRLNVTLSADYAGGTPVGVTSAPAPVVPATQELHR